MLLLRCFYRIDHALHSPEAPRSFAKLLVARAETDRGRFPILVLPLSPRLSSVPTTSWQRSHGGFKPVLSWFVPCTDPCTGFRLHYHIMLRNLQDAIRWLRICSMFLIQLVTLQVLSTSNHHTDILLLAIIYMQAIPWCTESCFAHGHSKEYNKSMCLSFQTFAHSSEGRILGGGDCGGVNVFGV